MFDIILSDETKFSCEEHETIIEAALRNDVYLDHSCLTGRCASCKCQVVKGNTYTDNEELSLNSLEKEQGYILTCVRKVKSDICIEAEDLGKYGLTKPQTIPAKINNIIDLTKDIKQISLRVPPNQKVGFLEGQYVNVLWNGLRRSYSIASTSKELEIQLILKNYPGGKMSQYWFNKCKVEDLLRLEIPKGTFFLRNHTNKENLIFLATGTGIAPIKAILESEKNQVELKKYKRIVLLWGMKNHQDFFWNPKSNDIEFFPIASREASPKKYVQNSLLELDIDFSKTVIYACGNDQMIQTNKNISIKKGLEARDFYSDAFVPSN